MMTCDICRKTFADKFNLNHHRRNLHKHPLYFWLKNYAKCRSSELSLALIKTHFPQKHQIGPKKFSIHCRFGFDDVEEFYKYLGDKHGSPRTPDPFREKSRPVASALIGDPKICTIPRSEEIN